MEAFAIDDLFDFPNEEEEEDNAVVNGGLDGASETVTVSSKSSADVTDELSGGNLADVSLSSELCEPHDELAELEWVSNFMEESFSNEDFQKLQLITGTKSVSGSNSNSFSGSSSSPETHTTQQPTKARTKRTRPAPNNWSSRLIMDSGSHLVNLNPVKKNPKPIKRKEPLAPCDGRKCLHCATDKTPQWRTGPFGPKTLCNACGVRYKSGRLVPEYRPAASPTFVNSKHSNSHRKVMELRRKNEMMQNQFGNGDGLLINHRSEPDFRKLV